jgi:hypothetical protein
MIYFLFFKKKKNPFTPKKIELKEAIENCTKQIYSSKLVPNRDIDAIVIGSGIGGLGLAALLSRQGRRVLVVNNF